MDAARFDSLTKNLAGSTTRRRVLGGIGALTLGSAVALGRSQMAAAQVSDEDKRRKCIERCVDRGGNNNLKDRRQRCRRKCQNRH